MSTWYVSKAGSDSNAGSFAAPWLTLGKLESGFGALITAGDTIRLRAGDVFTDSFLYNCIKSSVTVESYDPVTGLPAPVGQRAGILLATGTVVGASSASSVTLSNIDLSTSQPVSGAGQNTIVANDSGATCVGWTIRNCRIGQAGGNGIIVNNINSTGWTIDSNTIANLGDNGVLLNQCGGGHTIKNNVIHDVGLFNSSQGRHGVYAYCHDYTIYGNEFYNCPNGQGISMRNKGAGSAGVAYQNYIHDTPYGIGFFSNGDTTTGLLKAFANRIANVSVYGVFIGDGSTTYFDTLIAHNTISGTGACVGIDVSALLHASSTVKNNLVVGGTDAFYSNSAALDAGKTVAEDYNDFYGQTQALPFKYLNVRRSFADYKTLSGQSAHSIAAAPLLGAAPTYAPQVNSPTINAGTSTVAGLAYTAGGTGVWSPSGLDYAGAAPDIGHAEYLGPTPHWAVPGSEDEAWYARLPWEQSQTALAATSPVEASALSAVIGWHGTGLDAERGAFAVAQKGGKFDAWVGERVRVRAEGAPAAVFVYVHEVGDIDQDLSLPRRPFMELARLALDEVRGDVTRMR